MLDRARWEPGGGPSYRDSQRAAVAVGGAAGLFLSLVGLRVGYVAAASVGLPAWPVGLLCAGVAAALVTVLTWVIVRHS